MVVLVLHGMGDHIRRYTGFARELAKQGFSVFGYDQRGHGETGAAMASLGFLGEDGFTQLVEDVELAVHMIRSQHEDCKVILFGHSMGSFVVESYLTKYGHHVDGAILCGSNGPEGMMMRFGRLIADRYARRHGPRAMSQFLTNMTFGAYNRAFRPTRTDFDWLTRDTRKVDAYMADRYCGFALSAASMRDMFDHLMTMFKPANIVQIPRNLPIFIIAGEADPVGHQGKGIAKLERVYRRHGLSNLQTRLYPNARHELLNEINRDEVTVDIIRWIAETERALRNR